MARPLRIGFPGTLCHVTSRGNARAAVFLDEKDFARRADWLHHTVETYGWQVHAFVLMTNHNHLFVETPQPNLGAGMQYLNGSYTSYFNRRHRQDPPAGYSSRQKRGWNSTMIAKTSSRPITISRLMTTLLDAENQA